MQRLLSNHSASSASTITAAFIARRNASYAVSQWSSTSPQFVPDRVSRIASIAWVSRRIVSVSIVGLRRCEGGTDGGFHGVCIVSKPQICSGSQTDFYRVHQGGGDAVAIGCDGVD